MNRTPGKCTPNQPNTWKYSFETNQKAKITISDKPDAWKCTSDMPHVWKFIFMTSNSLKMSFSTKIFYFEPSRAIINRLWTNRTHENWIATQQLHENMVLELTGCPKNQLLTNLMRKVHFRKFILKKPNNLKMTFTRSTSVNYQLHTITSHQK